MITRPDFVFGSWEVGAYLDRWSLVHFAWGFMLAAILRMLGLSKKWAYVIALALMIGWELIELYLSAGDRIQNSILDIAVASAGFWLSYYWWPKARFMTDAMVATLIIGATLAVKIVAG